MEKKFKLALLILVALQLASAGQGKGISPVVKSLLVPGSGEYQLERPQRGRLFVLTEITLATGIAGSYIWSRQIDTRMQAFAADFAQVDPTAKPDQFWIDLGNYSSRDDFNDEHLRWRQIEQLYPKEEAWDWQWESDKKRSEFRDYRVRRDWLKKTGGFFAGALVLNHLVSAIDALYLTRLSAADAVAYRPQYNPITGSLSHSLIFSF